MLLAVVTGLLLASSPDTATNQTATPAERPEDRKICRKDIETGSLIKGKKVCMTARQWQKLADANRAEFESRSASGSQSGK